MKKAILSILLVALLLSICSCNNAAPITPSVAPTPASESPTSNPTESSNSIGKADGDDSTVSDEPVASPSPSPENTYTEVGLSEQITLDFVEMTLDSANYSDEVKPENPDRFANTLEDVEGETYVYVCGNIKNVSGDMFDFSRMYSLMTFDGKYNYDASVYGEEDGSLTYFSAELNPLKSEKFYIVASVPDEMVEMFSSIEVKFGFTENFEDGYWLEEDECDYLYSVTLVKE